MVIPKIRINPELAWDSLAVTIGVPVGVGGVTDGLGEDITVVGLGVCGAVAVACGVTSRISFCSGRMTDVALSPFQDIRSASGIS